MRILLIVWVIFFAVLLVLLSGCSQVDGWEVTKAYEFCVAHGGVSEYYDDSNAIICIDGTKKYIALTQQSN